jgi:hypothetical protein
MDGTNAAQLRKIMKRFPHSDKRKTPQGTAGLAIFIAV